MDNGETILTRKIMFGLFSEVGLDNSQFHIKESKLNTMIATKERPTLAMFARALEGGEVVGGGEAGLVTAGSGGSTTSATSKAGVGELAGGCVSSGIVFSRLPASAGMMPYEPSGMESEEHGLPAMDQCNMLVCKLVK
ncbi:unnamed protein product [Dovyalis caffra]|uniref:Uncharacterized protein n=1 Tax=Dovyalis caffra TaxID=77055 RepID=A0AAV1RPQ7_9ROSI|nr:unnamed protein product [Dovyalis caffra]